MGKTKKSHLLFSFLVRIVFIIAFYWRDLFVKDIITSCHWLHLNNYTPYENKKMFQSKKPNSSRGVRHARKFRLRTDASRNTLCSLALNTQLPRWTRHPPCYSNGWVEFWWEPMKLLVDKLNHAHWLRITDQERKKSSAYQYFNVFVEILR